MRGPPSGAAASTWAASDEQQLLLGRPGGQHHADRQPVGGPVQRQRDGGHPGDVPGRRPRRERLLRLEVARPGRRRRGSPRPAAAVRRASGSAPRRTARARPGSRAAMPAHRADRQPELRAADRAAALGQPAGQRAQQRARCSGGDRPTARSAPPSRSRTSARPPRGIGTAMSSTSWPSDSSSARGVLPGRDALRVHVGVGDHRLDEPGDPQPPGLAVAGGQERLDGGGAQDGSPTRRPGQHVEQRRRVAHGPGQRCRRSPARSGSPYIGKPLIRPRVGLSPTRPQQEAGIRIEPPPSEPCATGTSPAATAAAAPPDEPPAIRVAVPRRHRRRRDVGLGVAGRAELRGVRLAEADHPGRLDRAASTSSETSGTKSANAAEPNVVRTPAVRFRSLIAVGTPYSGAGRRRARGSSASARASARSASRVTNAPTVVGPVEVVRRRARAATPRRGGRRHPARAAVRSCSSAHARDATPGPRRLRWRAQAERDARRGAPPTTPR